MKILTNKEIKQQTNYLKQVEKKLAKLANTMPQCNRWQIELQSTAATILQKLKDRNFLNE